MVIIAKALIRIQLKTISNAQTGDLRSTRSICDTSSPQQLVDPTRPEGNSKLNKPHVLGSAARRRQATSHRLYTSVTAQQDSIT